MQTFVVRIWKPAEDEPFGPPALRGVVEQAGSGGQQAFSGEDELLELLRAGLAHEQEDGDRREEHRVGDHEDEDRLRRDADDPPAHT
jgi:hypothetical protein